MLPEASLPEASLPEARPAALTLRRPRPADGAALWRLVREMGGLELNSAYFYLLYCRDHAATSLLAQQDGNVVGFVLGHRPPTRPEALFVWQVGVAPGARRLGLGRRLLEALLARRGEAGWRYIEASVTPDNRASRRLFSGLAERHQVPCQVSPYLAAELFPESHAREDLLRIGPFPPATRAAPSDHALKEPDHAQSH